MKMFSFEEVKNGSALATTLKWALAGVAVAAGVVVLKVLENANRVARLQSTAEGILRERWLVYAIVFGITFLMAVAVADEALKRMMTAKERLLLLGAMVLFAGSFWVGGVYLSNRAFNRSVDATMEYHKLMRKWEPIWAEQAKKKSEPADGASQTKSGHVE